jgi:hypothetical protein
VPSPFPGMDPYLENPDIFPDFCFAFVIYLSESLQAQLPAPYYAALGRRTWIEFSKRSDGSDIPHDEISERFIEINVGRRSNRRLVTSIELLSLTNKTPGEHGRDLYLRKQREILQSEVHLVEIDLLRSGKHTSAVPESRLAKRIDRFDYHVCIHHFDNLEDYFIYPIQLTQPLPAISIPLLPGDPAVSLDLQSVFFRTYDVGQYDRDIDYRTDTVDPPLTPEQAEWAKGLISKSATAIDK